MTKERMIMIKVVYDNLAAAAARFFVVHLLYSFFKKYDIIRKEGVDKSD